MPEAAITNRPKDRPIELLNRLAAVRQTAHDRWIACCPAHEDNSPSLSIRELDDGRVLLHCFAGCDAIDVLASLGLDWSALYPQTDHRQYFPPTRPSKLPARELLEIISEEVTAVAVIAADMLERKTISEADWRRLALVAVLIGATRDELGTKPEGDKAKELHAQKLRAIKILLVRGT